MKDIINVQHLRKNFVVRKRAPGVWNAFKFLFSRSQTIKKALRDVSFSIKEGEIVGFIGPNGAGKSTTIKILSGILYPTAGTANILGFTPWQNRMKYVKNIGVVFGQKTQLYWDIPPLDTYYYYKELYDVDYGFEKRMRKMISLLGVNDVVTTAVRNLSLGERMKCELIASLVHNPKLVFLDEPSIGLDVIAKDKLRDFILDVNNREKTTFIVTTHDMQDIEKLCKRVIIINHGKIVYDGLLKNVKDKFVDYKRIIVKFNTAHNKFRFNNCNIRSEEEYETTIHVNTKRQKVHRVIAHLVSNFDVADIEVKDPPIEEIIQRIFLKRL